MKLTHKAILATLITAASPLAMAHPGHVDGLAAGIAHPFTGLDHLVMLLGVGALGAWQTRGRRVGLYAGALTSMLAGALLGLATGWGQGVELMILLSLVVMAVTLWFRRDNPMAMAAALVMVLFHGWAHGLEVMPSQVLTFMPGMMIGASVIMAAGYGLGRQCRPKMLGAGSGLAAIAVALLG